MLQVSDAQPAEVSENGPDSTSFSINYSAYQGPGADIINKSVQGWKDMLNDINFNIFLDNTKQERENNDSSNNR